MPQDPKKWEKKMKKLIKILRELHPDENITENTSLIKDEVLDSLDIVTLVTDINEEYRIEIGAEDITPENFESVRAISSLIRRRGGEICN